MKNIIGCVVVLSALASACGATKTPRQMCTETTPVYCDRVFQCLSASERSSHQFAAAFGSSAAQCVTNINGLLCSAIDNDNPCTNSSQKYDADKAASCFNDFQDITCEEFKSSSGTNPSCSAVCS